MKNKKNIQIKLSKFIQSKAIEITKKTVGKSTPYHLHEIDISDSIIENIKKGKI